MVGILQFFDFGQASSSRKLSMLNTHFDGFEAPRNSLEFPMEAYQSLKMVREDIRYSQHYSDKEDSCQQRAHMIKLIDEEMPNRTKDRCNRPSVVARLMGMDALPSNVKPMIYAKELNDEERPRKESNGISSNQQVSFILKSMKNSNKDLPNHIQQDFDQHNRNLEMNKPQPREHPQEELLQKFKKEFEAWQASKVWEKSVTLELGNDLQKKKYISTPPQEILSKEKTSRYGDPKRSSFMKKTKEPRYHVLSARPNIACEPEDLVDYEAFVTKLSENVLIKDNAFQDDPKSNFFTSTSNHRMNMTTSPRRIVILKPSYEMNDSTEESCFSSPVMLEKEKKMHDFLEQVKERLIIEIQGKPRIETTTRWTKSEVFVSGRLADSKQILPKTIKQIGVDVSKDSKTTLMQSKSTRVYRNEVQISEKNSPEFISRKTRKWMKNVLKDETEIRYPLISSERSSRSLSSEVEKFSSMQYPAKKSSTKKVAYREDKKALTESKSFRHDQRQAFDDEEESQRNLVRSFSAPVSGTAFGKLLLEDKHALTAVQICRKHEASEIDLMEVRKIKKDGFSIKNKVSSLRQNFTLKGKLFGKRIKLMDESAEDEFPFMKATEAAPSVVMNLGFAQDNSTEVPPSPASVCSSSQDEICRPYYPSPVSPLEALFHEDHPSSASAQLNSNLLDSSLSEEIEYDRSEEATDEIKPAEDEPPELECDAKAYVRDVLVTSGLFERNHFNQVLWEWNTPRKPISSLVFEEVEEKYRRSGKLEGGTLLLCNGHIDVGHRILFDLLNEALLRVVQNSKPGPTFKNWFLGARRLPHGDELLDSLWHLIQLYINLVVDESCAVESIVAQHVNGTPWSGMLHEDIDIICVEMELLILENLVDELVCNL